MIIFMSEKTLDKKIDERIAKIEAEKKMHELETEIKRLECTYGLGISPATIPSWAKKKSKE